MATKKNYSRYFIILQEDEKGYSIGTDKLTSGYTKIEMKNEKCKVSYYVQNLKKEKGPYYMALICNKKDVKKLINVGRMNIDDYGRVDISYEYNIDNIADSNISMDKIIGSAIIKEGGSSVVSVMSGFSCSNVPSDWKSYSIVQNKKQKEMEKKINKEIKKEEKKINKEVEKLEKELDKKIKNCKDLREEKRDNIEVIANEIKENKKNIEVITDNKENIKEEINKFEEYEKGIENADKAEKINNEKKDIKENLTQGEKNKLRKELKSDVEDIKENLKIEMDKIKKDLKNDLKEYIEDLTDIIKDKNEPEKKDVKLTNENNETFNNDNKNIKKQNKLDSTTKFFKNLAKDFDEVQGIFNDIKKCQWFKIPSDIIDDVEDEAYYKKYTVFYYPMNSYKPYISKYGYYMVGYKYDNNSNIKYIIYAVPGTKSKRDQPFQGRTGFVTWAPFGKDSDLGCWLMFYDFKNSEILIPIEK